MTTWRITYPDGTFEEVRGSSLRVYENVLTIEQSHQGAYDRRSRSWPLASIRSWEALS